MRYFTRGDFYLVDADEAFDGYTDGEVWNGFASPYFERAVAEQILKSSHKRGYRALYDQEQDAFIVSHSDDPTDYEPEVFGAQKILVDGKELNVYPVGAYSWTWRRR